MTDTEKIEKLRELSESIRLVSTSFDEVARQAIICTHPDSKNIAIKVGTTLVNALGATESGLTAFAEAVFGEELNDV